MGECAEVERQLCTRRRQCWRAAAAAFAVLVASACGGGPADTDRADTAQPVQPSSAVPPSTTGPTGSSTTGPNTPAPRPLPERVTLKISRTVVPGVVPFANVLLAQELGEFAKENLNVEFVFENVVNALVLTQQGRIDGGYLGFSAGTLNAFAQGADIEFVLPTGTVRAGDPTGLWARTAILPASGRFDPCVLGRGVREDGTTVISLSDPTGLGSPHLLWLTQLVARCPGLTLEDVKGHLTVSKVVGPDLLIALRQGAVDIAFVAPPLTGAPGITDVAAPIHPMRPEGPAIQFSGWAFGSVRHEHPEVVEAFVRAAVRTSRTYLQGDYLSNPAVLDALAAVLQTPRDQLAGGPTLEFDAAPALDARALAALQEAWLEVGELLTFDEPIAGDRILDSGPLDRVLPAL